ncbi:MAG: haloacid dehalogenase-like hydrolase, partial [Cytophagales bacterium]
MKITSQTQLFLGVVILLSSACQNPDSQKTTETPDSEISFLNSWNEGNTKFSIQDFVERTSTEGSSDFVPEMDRIAVFDNDGTLWAEQPFYFQLAYSLDYVKKEAPNHPDWAKDPVL